MKIGIAALILSLCVGAWASDFTYEDLETLIISQQLRSIDSVLPKLPPMMLSNYTLMYASGSLQGASFQNPRVILFGANARLTCAFNGDPSQAGYDTLECFQFRDADRKFDFRQIQFPTEQNGLSDVKFSAPNRTADGSISCTSCHSTDPRPNWDQYNTWHGAYGSGDDVLYENYNEVTTYASFVSARPNHPRYKWLIQGSLATDPYLGDGNGPITVDIGKEPNLRFSDSVCRLNAHRTARILESTLPRWQGLAFALSALSCSLTTDEQNQITHAGLNLAADTNLGTIFNKLHLSGNDWSTEITKPDPDPQWEHLSGFSLLSIDTAMVLIQERATAGDVAFQNGLNQILTYYQTAHLNDGYGDYLNALNLIAIDPDFFSPSYATNVGYLCPELGKVFTSEYLKSAVSDSNFDSLALLKKSAPSLHD